MAAMMMVTPSDDEDAPIPMIPTPKRVKIEVPSSTPTASATKQGFLKTVAQELPQSGFQERDASSRRKLEKLVHSVPEQYRAMMKTVIMSVPRSTERNVRMARKVRKVADLASRQPGAKLRSPLVVPVWSPVHRVKKGLALFRNVLDSDPRAGEALITAILSEGRKPSDILGGICDEFLGTEWVLDHQRIDELSKPETAAKAEPFLVYGDIPFLSRPCFDEIYEAIADNQCGLTPLFERAVRQWANDRNVPENK